MHAKCIYMHTATMSFFLTLPCILLCLQELYEYVFSTGCIEGSFTLCTAFPRQVLMPSKQSVGNCGVITVEIRDDSPELQAILADIATTSTSSVVRKHNVL